MQEFTPFDIDEVPAQTGGEAADAASAEGCATTDRTRREQPGSETLLTAHDLHLLLDVVSQLNAVGEPQALLPFIIETAAELLDCDAASLLLYDEATDRLRFEAATGSDAATLAEIPVPLFGSIAGEIFREGETVNTSRAQDDARHYSDVGRKVDFKTQSLLGVPMHIEGQIVGVLEALNKRNGAFDTRDEHLLAILADHVAVTLRNVRQRAAIREAYDRLAHIESTKSRFVTLTSHELRTPLATIQGFATMLRDDAREDNVRDYAGLIVESALRMGAVVDVMSELNDLRLGSMLPAVKARAANRVLHKARRTLEPHAAAKKLQVRIEPAAPDLKVHADLDKLDRALAHLVTNAVTHTPKGGTVVLSAFPQEGGIVFKVADTGCGIAEEHLEAIFREYFQVEHALTRSHGGLGLGLTVARGIAEVHGGRLWAASEGVGHGATFSLWLPGPDPHVSEAVEKETTVQ